MDTSETYMKMCDCPEIQTNKPNYDGLERNALDTFSYLYMGEHGHWWWSTLDKNIWLPRQDQLQEILPEFIAKAGFVAPVASHFADFAVACANDPRYWNLDTFEQLWLAFVMHEMHEKYRKVWDGEKWIKE